MGRGLQVRLQREQIYPPMYLGASQHQACQEFFQRNHGFSCCFIEVMNLLVINLQCFTIFLARVIIRVVCPAQKNGVPTTRTSGPFGDDIDFVETGWGVPNPCGSHDIKLVLSDLQLGTYTSNKVKLIGACELYVVHPSTKSIEAVTFFVACNEGSVLMSYTTCLALGLIKPHPSLDYLPPGSNIVSSSVDQPINDKS